MAQQNALAAAAAAAVQQQQQQQQQHQQSAAAAASFYAKSFSNTGVRTAQSRLYWGAVLGCGVRTAQSRVVSPAILRRIRYRFSVLYGGVIWCGGGDAGDRPLTGADAGRGPWKRGAASAVAASVRVGYHRWW